MLLSKFDKFFLLFFAVIVLIIFVSGTVLSPGGLVPNNVAFHPLQFVSVGTDAESMVSVDADEDGVIDASQTITKNDCSNGEIIIWNGSSWECGDGSDLSGIPPNPKILSGMNNFTNGSCGKVSTDPCIIDISAGNFTTAPNCTISMKATDGSGYTENMVIKGIATTQLQIWEGQYYDDGTTMRVYWICVEN